MLLSQARPGGNLNMRFGSFSIEPPATSSPVMSAVRPITTESCAHSALTSDLATEFRARQGMAVSAMSRLEQVR
jgi:hypothetical protein